MDIIETKTLKGWYGDYEVKQIKDAHFKDSNKMRSTKLAKSENLDCVVRAFMVTLDLPYDQAHKWVATKLKREYRKGTYTRKYLGNILGKQKNGYKLSLMGFHPVAIGKDFPKKKLVNPKYKKETGYTVKSFMEQHMTGRYFLIVKGHALALVDGVLYGNGDEQFKGFKRRLLYVLKAE